jgi:Zn-dependent protease
MDNLQSALLNVVLFWMLTAPHEFAHAWTAVRLGDETPRRQGRLTLNPLAHVDWLGTVFVPAATSLLGGGFLGWGRAVETDPSRLRGGNKGLAVVALAGPAMNLLMGVLLAVGVGVLARTWVEGAELGARAILMSLYLAVFNLLPVPPLDGSKLLLAAKVPAVIYVELSRYGFVLLLVAFHVTQLGTWMGGLSYEGTRLLIRTFTFL